MFSITACVLVLMASIGCGRQYGRLAINSFHSENSFKFKIDFNQVKVKIYSIN